MDKLLLRPCPRCGAAIGEHCVMKSGKPVLKVVGVHSARFIVKTKKTMRADHYSCV